MGPSVVVISASHVNDDDVEIEKEGVGFVVLWRKEVGCCLCKSGMGRWWGEKRRRLWH